MRKIYEWLLVCKLNLVGARKSTISLQENRQNQKLQLVEGPTIKWFDLIYFYLRVKSRFIESLGLEEAGGKKDGLILSGTKYHGFGTKLARSFKESYDRKVIELDLDQSWYRSETNRVKCYRALALSTAALSLNIVVLSIWTVLALNIRYLGFNFTVEEAYTIGALPIFIGFFSAFIFALITPALGSRTSTLLNLTFSILSLYYMFKVIQEPTTNYNTMLYYSGFYGLSGGILGTSFTFISMLFPRFKQTFALGILGAFSILAILSIHVIAPAISSLPAFSGQGLFLESIHNFLQQSILWTWLADTKALLVVEQILDVAGNDLASSNIDNIQHNVLHQSKYFEDLLRENTSNIFERELIKEKLQYYGLNIPASNLFSSITHNFIITLLHKGLDLIFAGDEFISFLQVQLESNLWISANNLKKIYLQNSILLYAPALLLTWLLTWKYMPNVKLKTVTLMHYVRPFFTTKLYALLLITAIVTVPFSIIGFSFPVLMVYMFPTESILDYSILGYIAVALGFLIGNPLLERLTAGPFPIDGRTTRKKRPVLALILSVLLLMILILALRYVWLVETANLTYNFYETVSDLKTSLEYTPDLEIVNNIKSSTSTQSFLPAKLTPVDTINKIFNKPILILLAWLNVFASKSWT